jgi:hypothetical protein
MSTAKKPVKKIAKKSTGRVTPKKEQVVEEPTSAETWKAKSTSLVLHVPSGNNALVRNPGIKAFITAGILPNSLMPIVTEALERGKPPSMSAFQDKIKTDPGMLEEMLVSIDNVTLRCVIEPQVHPMPTWDLTDHANDSCTAEQIGQEAPQKKDPRRLYIDEVDLDDKLFIFQWAVGGTRDLERFRQEYSTGLAAL